MHIKRVDLIAAMAGLTAASWGCSQAPSGDVQATDQNAVPVASTLLASVELERGHTIKFLQADAGFVFIAATGNIAGSGPRMQSPDVGGKSPVDVYRLLAPGAEVPRALVAAATRPAALSPATPYAPDDATDHGSGPRFYTSAEQTWFSQTFCSGAVKCIQGWDWIDSGWDYTTSWKSTAFIGSEGTVTIPHNALYWKCSGGSCSWSVFYTVMLPPGGWTWITGGGLFYYKSTISGAGSGTQVSMAINDAPYQCAHCNDGSCQCGYMDGNNLCSGHGGNNPSIGCTMQ